MMRRTITALLLLFIIAIAVQPLDAQKHALTFTEKIRLLFGDGSSGPGVRYHVFDVSDESSAFGNDIASFTNGGQTNAVPPVLDTSVKFSGQNSLKFTIPSQSSSGASGQWTMCLVPACAGSYGAGESFSVQWQQKFGRYFIEHNYLNATGWKQSIIGEADGMGCSAGNTGPCASSCTDLEIVTQNTFLRGFPQMYNSCGSFTPFEYGPIYGSDFDRQPHQGNPPPMGSYCFTGAQAACYRYDEWFAGPSDQVSKAITFTVAVNLGADSGGFFQDSRVRMWIYVEGDSAAVKAFDYVTDLVSSSSGTGTYGRIWLLPYHSGKDATEVTSESYTWYGNVIISRQPIPKETSEVADDSDFATTAFAMPARSWAEITLNSTKDQLFDNGTNGNILPFAFHMEWCQGKAYHLGIDHHGGAPGIYIRSTHFDSTNSNWYTDVDEGDNSSLQGHGYDHLAYDCPNDVFYFRTNVAASTRLELFKADGIADPFDGAAVGVGDLTGMQVASGVTWWSGALTGGGAEGTVVVYECAFNGTVFRYRPITDDFAADVSVGAGTDTYHCFLEYSPRLNLAVFGGGNANPTLLRRLNSNATISSLGTAPTDLGIQRANVVNEPVTGKFLVMGGGVLRLYDPVADTWTTLDGAGDAIPMGVGDPADLGDVASFAAAEYGVSCYVTATGSSNIKMHCYKYADSIAEGEIDPTNYLAFVQQPGSITAGDSFSPAVTVEVCTPPSGGSCTRDTGASDSVTVSLAGCGSASLTGTTSRTASSGLATFTGLGATGSGTGCTLVATASGLSSDSSDAFNVTAVHAGRGRLR